MSKSLIVACDGEAASGKSTGAKLLSKKYKLLLLNSGLLYRYASKILIKKKPKKPIPYLKKIFKKTSYNLIQKQSLHSQEISNHVGYLAKNKGVREIMKNSRVKARFIRGGSTKQLVKMLEDQMQNKIVLLMIFQLIIHLVF